MACVSCNNIKTPHTYHSPTGRLRKIRECFCGTASQAIGDIYPGCEIFGFTKGQFSLMDIISAIMYQIDEADVSLSTWTAARSDIEHAYQFLRSGKVRSSRWIVDASFPSRDPIYFGALVKRFGAEAIRLTKTHAKFVLIRNDDWNIVVRSSMNLNNNPRFENFEISDDLAFAEYFQLIVDEIFTQPDVAVIPELSEVDQQFMALSVLGETYENNTFDLEPNIL